MRLHHIAYAVDDLEVAGGFASLGFIKEGSSINDEDRHVAIQFLKTAEGERIELVAPLDEMSPVSKRLHDAKGFSHPYHLCFEVEDLEDSIRHFSTKGFMRISAPSPAPAIGGRRVAFLMSRTVGLIELVEEQ